MAEALFRIVPDGEEWRLEHDDRRVAYMTKEAAFEAAVLAAQRAMREACAVHISVDTAPNVLVGSNQG